MSAWEYKVVPAPTKGVKTRGLKGPEAFFAHAIETLMNEMATDGWEFQRTETLPSTERSGLTGSTTQWRNLMVFRRAVTDDADAFEHELLPAPDRSLDPEPTSTPPPMVASEQPKAQIESTSSVAGEAIDEFEHTRVSATATASPATDDSQGHTPNDPNTKPVKIASLPSTSWAPGLSDATFEGTAEAAGVTSSANSKTNANNALTSKD